MYTLIGEVTSITASTVGYEKTRAVIGVDVTTRIEVPYVGLKYGEDSEYEDKIASKDVSFFVPVTEIPPTVGQTVKLTLVTIFEDPADELDEDALREGVSTAQGEV